MDEVLYPGEIGVAPRGKAELPARVVVFAEPVGVVEGRIGEHEVGAQIGMEIAPECVGLLFAEICFDAADGEVHHGEAARGGVAFLTVDADIAELAAVGFDEFFRLHEHAAGTAAGIVNAAFVRSEHLDEKTHDALRRVELATFLSFGAREPAKEVFVDAAEDVFRAVRSVAHADRADKVDEFAEAILVEGGTGVVFRQDAFQSRVVALDRDHGIIDNLADARLLCAILEIAPARSGWNPKDVFGAIFVGILWIRAGAFAFACDKLRMVFLETVGDVLEEN